MKKKSARKRPETITQSMLEREMHDAVKELYPLAPRPVGGGWKSAEEWARAAGKVYIEGVRRRINAMIARGTWESMESVGKRGSRTILYRPKKGGCGP